MSNEEIKETMEQVNEKENTSSLTDLETTNQENVDEVAPEVEKKPTKRRRGRPRKNQSVNSKVEETKVEETKVEETKVEETKADTKPKHRRKTKTIDQIEPEVAKPKVIETKVTEQIDPEVETKVTEEVESKKVDKENVFDTYKSTSKTEDNINLTDTGVNGTLLVYKTPSNESIRRAIAGRFEYVSDYNDVFITVKYVKPSTGLIFGYARKSEYIDKINS